MNIYNPKLIIGIGFLFFLIAFIDSLTVKTYRYDNWFESLHLIGKASVVGVGLSLLWLILSTVIKRR
jgi:multisubunit Na+/H+ antiporter MnhB subunit